MKCKFKNSRGWTTIRCCNDCGLPIPSEPWDVMPIKEYKCLDCGQVNGAHNMVCEGNFEKGEYLCCPDCWSQNVDDWAMIPETNKHYIIFERPIGSEVFTRSTRACFQSIYHKHETAKKDIDAIINGNKEMEFSIYVCRPATIHKYSIVSVS